MTKVRVVGIREETEQGRIGLPGSAVIEPGDSRRAVRSIPTGERRHDGFTVFVVSGHVRPSVVRTEAREVCGDADPQWNQVQQLAYTRQVIQETMRLFPPIWGLIRIAAGDDDIQGHKIKAGDKVVILSYIAHHSPKYWTTRRSSIQSVSRPSAPRSG